MLSAERNISTCTRRADAWIKGMQDSQNRDRGPINYYIYKTVSDKALLRHHHIHNLHRTVEEFEQWWRVKTQRVIEEVK